MYYNSQKDNIHEQFHEVLSATEHNREHSPQTPPPPLPLSPSPYIHEQLTKRILLTHHYRYFRTLLQE